MCDVSADPPEQMLANLRTEKEFEYLDTAISNMARGDVKKAIRIIDDWVKSVNASPVMLFHSLAAVVMMYEDMTDSARVALANHMDVATLHWLVLTGDVKHKPIVPTVLQQLTVSDVIFLRTAGCFVDECNDICAAAIFISAEGESDDD